MEYKLLCVYVYLEYYYSMFYKHILHLLSRYSLVICPDWSATESKVLIWRWMQNLVEFSINSPKKNTMYLL